MGFWGIGAKEIENRKWGKGNLTTSEEPVSV